MGKAGEYRQVAPEVFYATEPFETAGPDAVNLIKRVAGESPKKRARICFHPSPETPAQEMLIAMSGDSYVRPHRHLGKSETLTVLEGTATVMVFDNAGSVEQRVLMAPYGSDHPFFYRMPSGVFHTLIFHSDIFVYLETTTGPFDPKTSEVAPWAPPETEHGDGLAYLRRLA